MKNPILLELLTYWEGLRGRRLAPMRAEIDPRKIENVLEYAFILERPDDDHATSAGSNPPSNTPSNPVRFRIAGMHLCSLMGMELRAMPAFSIFEPEARAGFRAALADQFRSPQILEMSLAAHCAVGAPLLADMLLLPLTNDNGQTNRMLGCLVSDSRTHCPPHRFRITGQHVTRIVTAKDMRIPAPAAAPVAGFAEQPAPFVSPQRASPPNTTLAGPASRHLHLVDADET